MNERREEELEDKVQHWKRLAIIFAFCLAGMIVLVIVTGTMKNSFEGRVKELTAALEAVEPSSVSQEDQIVRIDNLELDSWSVDLEYNGTYTIHMNRDDVRVYLKNIEDREAIATRFMELYAISNVTGAD